MKIKSLAISDWRSIKFRDLMIFIDQNNHGKSSGGVVRQEMSIVD